MIEWVMYLLLIAFLAQEVGRGHAKKNKPVKLILKQDFIWFAVAVAIITVAFLLVSEKPTKDSIATSIYSLAVIYFMDLSSYWFWKKYIYRSLES